MKETVADFNEFRDKQNQRLLKGENLLIKRLFRLDGLAYQEGALPVHTKELLGLAMSLVLRCDDCVKYHLEQAMHAGATENEILEVLGLAQLVGGSIAIPHARKAMAWWDQLKSTSSQENPA